MKLRSPISLLLLLAALALTGCGVGTAQTDLRTAVDAQQSTLDDCYRVALERDREASGSMRLRLHMEGGTNTVREVEVLDSELHDAQLTECVDGVLSGLSIEQAPAGSMAVDYTLEFAPRS